MYKKNGKVELNIIDINTEGLGIAKFFDIETNKNIVFFVKDALVGDTIEAVITKINKTVIFAKTIKIIKESQYRIDSKCKVSNKCGGCQLLSLEYKKQLEIKKEMVKNNLINIAKIDSNVLLNIDFDIISMNNPYNFRNKIIIPFGKRNGNIVSGYYAGRTHYIIDNEYCITAFKGHDIIIKIIKELLKKYNISIYDEKTNKGIFRQLMLRKANETDELSITFIVNDANPYKHIDKYNQLTEDLINEFDTKSNKNDMHINITSVSLNINISKNNVLLGKESILLYGNDYIKDKMTLSINDNNYCLFFNISDLSFYQTNMYMTKILYETVFGFANIKKNEKVIDLYCGIGTMTLFAALVSDNVLGIEIVDKAVTNAKKNSELNNIHNASFICSDLDKDLLFDNDKSKLKNNCDILIADPPRKGLSDNVKKHIIEYSPKRIVYVSCDSATLSRDLRYILDNSSYKIDKIKVIDMFAHTMHVETVVLLSI